jgi:hypothetical protein
MRGNRQRISKRLDNEIKGANSEVRRLAAILVLLWIAIGIASYLWWIPELIPDSGKCFTVFPVDCLEVENLAKEIVAGSIGVAIIWALSYALIQHFDNIKEDLTKREIASHVVMELEDALADHPDTPQKFVQYGLAGSLMSLDTIKQQALNLHCNDIRIMTTWFTNAGLLYQLFNDVAKENKNHYRIQILLLNPNSVAAKQRSHDLEEVSEDTVPHGIRECRAAIERLNLSRIEIRYYDSLPSFPLYIFDNHAFYGLFPHGMWADNGPWIEVQLRNPDNHPTDIGRFLTREFEKVWEKAVPVRQWDGQR